MNRSDILALINSGAQCTIATVENGEPRVRGIMPYAADDRGFIFHTGNMKPLSAQLEANGTAELCFVDPKIFTQVRVRGTFKNITSRAMIDEILADPKRQFLRDMKERAGDEAFYGFIRVYAMEKGEARVWTMATNLQPQVPIAMWPAN